jgi:UDP-N-acetylglucosamine--N-acetylmuramyl-(pentapeptide) pyrophosphoryl-undecaprenol N-acetylglucosamine transferase
MVSMPRVAIVAGGTGGHVFPALAVARSLLPDCLSLFVTDQRGAPYLDSWDGEIVVHRYWHNPRFCLYCSLVYNFFKCFSLYRKIKQIDYIIGFGGYPSLPFLLFSRLLGKKIAIHEQNSVVGKANKLLSMIARDVFVSFRNTKGLEHVQSILTGNPTRFEQLYKNVKYECPSDAMKVLVIGGSQGSKIFSIDVLDVICSTKKITFVYHQARKEDIRRVKEKYTQHSIECEVKDFFADINTILCNVDLVISRAGASSLFETIGFKRPSILIPFKKSINGDQEHNAEVMRKAGCAIVIDECAIANLGSAIEKVTKDKSVLRDMAEKTKSMYIKRPSEKIAQKIRQTIAQKTS